MVSVSRLSFTPVRGLGLSHPDSIELTEMGLVQDRRFYLVDEHGRLVDRLLAAQLVQVRADTNDEATWLRMTFPDGAVLEDQVRLDEPVRTRSTAGSPSAASWAGRGRQRSSRSHIGGC